MCNIAAWKSDFRLAKGSRGNDAWCHRSNAVVSSGMHMKFPESFLKDVRLGLVRDLSWDAERWIWEGGSEGHL